MLNGATLCRHEPARSLDGVLHTSVCGWFAVCCRRPSEVTAFISAAHTFPRRLRGWYPINQHSLKPRPHTMPDASLLRPSPNPKPLQSPRAPACFASLSSSLLLAFSFCCPPFLLKSGAERTSGFSCHGGSNQWGKAQGSCLILSHGLEN